MLIDWEIVEFDRIAGVSKKKFDPQKGTEHKTCIELEHIAKESGRLIGSTSSETQLSTKNVFQKKDVLFGKLRPNLRKYAYCNFDGVCSSEIWVLTAKQNIYPKFLFFLIQQEKFISSACVVSGSKMPRANWDYVSRVPFAIPPLTEQKAIADTLQTWDATIEKAEALIAAKERQFRWLTKSLMRISSNNHLPKTLKEIATIKKGQQLNRDTLSTSGLHPVWNGGIIPSGFTDKQNASANTITISEGGNSCGFVNFCCESFWLGGHCYALEKVGSNIFPRFLFFFLKANEQQIMRLRVGSGLPNIQKKDLERLEVRYPSLREQKRIAKTLGVAQHEIDLLKKLAEQYRTQKRGLMQKLLSGEWRIIGR